MAKRLVSVDEEFNLPPEVQEQLVGPVRDEFETLTDQAMASASAASASATSASASATAADNARAIAESAAATATAPVDSGVAALVADTGSATYAALDTNNATLIGAASATRTALDVRYARYSEGLFSARPTAASAGAGRQYYATDTFELYQSNGTIWRVLSNAGEVGRAAITAGQSTTGVLDVSGLSISWTAGERPVGFWFSGDLAHSVSGSRVTLAAYLDGATGANHLGAVNFFPVGSDIWSGAAFDYAIPVLTPGTAHSIRLTMSTPAATARISNASIKVISR